MEQNFINTIQNQEEAQQNPPYTPYSNSSNSDTTYNSTQNIMPPEEPYYSSQSTDKVQQYQTQSYSTQNIVVPPNQPYYPPQGNAPIQPGVSGNSYQLQPMSLNAQPIHQNQYHKPYSLVQHRGILQTENNTYFLTFGFFYKIIPFLPFFVGLLFIMPSVFFLPEALYPFILGFIFITWSIIFCFKAHYCVFIILGPNTLTVIKKGICNKKCAFYNPGDLERIEFTETKERGKSRRSGYIFCYVLKVVEKNGKEDVIFNKGGPSKLFTSDEIEYFLYTVNTHIQTKMKV